jgi:hypothetical protein
MKTRTIAVLGGLGVAAIALIGAGASATFTASTSSSQTITAGTASVVTWSGDATNGCTTEAIAIADDCTSVTLPVETVGSTFDSPSSVVWVDNDGNIPVEEASFGVSGTVTNSASLDNGGTLESELGMCIWSDTAAVYNGALTAFPAYDSVGGYIYPAATAALNVLAVNGQDSYAADFYAGMNSKVCGAGGAGGGSPTPAETTSLTNLASGGSVTVTLTPDYTG